MSSSEGMPIEFGSGPAVSADKRRLAAILLADVVGYSRLMHDDDGATLAALMAHRHELIEPEIAGHDGRLVNTAGDSLLAEFASVVQALACAVEIQRQMPGRNAQTPPYRRVQFRIGIALGEIIAKGGDIFGDGVNTAARLQCLARPDEICVSADVYRQVRGKLNVEFEDLGEHAAKNLPDPLRVFRVMPAAAKAEAVPPWAPKTGSAHSVGPLVAVLPFDNLSGDAGRDYFSDGITNDLITDLSLFPDLAVIASHSVFAYKGKPVRIETIARDLGVRYVVEGSVQHAGSKVRINAQLIDTLTGRHMWSQRYNRDLEDLFAVQDEIAHSIAATVFRRLEISERERALRKPTDSLEAYDHFLRGQAVWYGWTRESNVEAQAHFRRAIELDPNFARAYGALAYTLVQAVLDGWADEVTLREARELARIAVVRGPSDFENLEHLGFVSLYCHEFDRSLACYEQALELNPNSADLLADMADMLAHIGRTAEAVAYIARAKQLNPICPEWYDWVLGIAAFHDGRYEEALAAFTRAGNPSTFLLREMVATYVRLGRMDEARLVAHEVLRRQPNYRLSAESIRPFKDPKVLESFIADLRRAGLPD